MKFTEEVGCSEVITGAWFPTCTNPVPGPQDLSFSCSVRHEDPQEEAVRQESLPECTRTGCDHKHSTQTIYLINGISVMPCLEYCKGTINSRLESKLNYLT